MSNHTLCARTGVIVTDGNERSALAVTRSLGQRGIPVYVGAETAVSLAGSSKYCTQSFVYPSPWSHPEEYVACLLDVARQWNATALFPMTDLAVELIGEHKERVGLAVTLPIPSLKQYRKLSDKYQLTVWAKEQGIPIPPTLFVPDGDVAKVIDQVTKWPVVVKPGRSLLKVEGMWKKTTVLYAHDPHDLLRLYHEVWYLKWPSLLQERISGEGEGVFGLFSCGEPLALFAHRRLRERPPSGGVSVLRESIPLPPQMTDYALRVIKSADWHGVAMVEFKVDRDSDVPYLMEVNGRFWGSLQLAIDAGVDFPWLLHQHGTGEVIAGGNEQYQVGIKSRWWLGDLDHLLLRLWKTDKELSLPTGSPSRLETIKNFFSVFDPKTKPEVFRLLDLKPGIHEIGTYFRPLIRRVASATYKRLLDARLALARAAWAVGVALRVHRFRTKQALCKRIATVLVLCKGNICRSPFAAGYLETESVKRRLSMKIFSAGLDTTAGKPAYPLAAMISKKCGIDLGSHLTTVISKDMIEKADLILVMEITHTQMLFRLFPEARTKTVLLGHLSPDPLTDIRDPYGGTPEEFEQCYALIVKACDGLLHHLQASTQVDAADKKASRGPSFEGAPRAVISNEKNAR
jgi:predicted ATP-grasp superfamily ATP-dependent carboligase/protein-tyrosine-phosphatase